MHYTLLARVTTLRREVVRNGITLWEAGSTRVWKIGSNDPSQVG